MAECNMPGCSTSSLCDSLASDTRFTTVSSDGEDVEDSGGDASDSSSRTSAEPESILRVSNLKCEGWISSDIDPTQVSRDELWPKYSHIRP